MPGTWKGTGQPFAATNGEVGQPLSYHSTKNGCRNQDHPSLFGHRHIAEVTFRAPRGGDTMADEITRTFHYTILSDAVIDDERVGKNELLVYMVLCRYSGKERTAFPGIRLLAQKARLSPNTAQAALNNLVTLGYLKIEKRTRGDTQAKTSHLYTLVEVCQFPGGVSATDTGGVSATDTEVSLSSEEEREGAPKAALSPSKTKAKTKPLRPPRPSLPAEVFCAVRAAYKKKYDRTLAIPKVAAAATLCEKDGSELFVAAYREYLKDSGNNGYLDEQAHPWRVFEHTYTTYAVRAKKALERADNARKHEVSCQIHAFHGTTQSGLCPECERNAS